MKTSNRILIGVGSAVVVVAVLAVITARIIMGDTVNVQLSDGPRIFTGPETTKRIDVKDFTGIAASGAWIITLKEGADYSLAVTAPQDLMGRMDVYAGSQMLHLGLKPGVTSANHRLYARITMPSLRKLELSGANQASFSGFSGGQLSIECSGAVAVSGSEGSYDRVEVTASGASSVMFRNLPTTSADVRLSGAGQAELNMKGGPLTGQLSGAGKVTYWGTVSSQTIKTSGIGSVTHRKEG